jgi:hypothetical protein
MKLERRVFRQISGEYGVLTDKAGTSSKVRFSLTQWREYIDDLPSLEAGRGSISFQPPGAAWSALQGGTPKTLTGAGIQAKILMETAGTFRVTGPVTDIT